MFEVIFQSSEFHGIAICQFYETLSFDLEDFVTLCYIRINERDYPQSNPELPLYKSEERQYLVFKTEGMVPWSPLDASKVDSPSTDNHNVEDSARGWRGLLVHCKVDIKSRTTTDRGSTRRHYSTKLNELMVQR
jgi:hypothetical protein